jgi:hypothetical protein
MKVGRSEFTPEPGRQPGRNSSDPASPSGARNPAPQDSRPPAPSDARTAADLRKMIGPATTAESTFTEAEERTRKTLLNAVRIVLPKVSAYLPRDKDMEGTCLRLSAALQGSRGSELTASIDATDVFLRAFIAALSKKSLNAANEMLRQYAETGQDAGNRVDDTALGAVIAFEKLNLSNDNEKMRGDGVPEREIQLFAIRKRAEVLCEAWSVEG